MKRAGKLLVIGLFSLLLSGCMFTTPETSLYRLPKLAGEYESLESQIDALLTKRRGVCRAHVGQQFAERADDRPRW